MLGLLLALWRLLLLLATALLALGRLDETLFALGAGADQPHASFLAAVKVSVGMLLFCPLFCLCE